MSNAPASHPNSDVQYLSPEGAIAPTGTWTVGSRAGDYVFVAGMRGIDPETNTLVEGDEARILQGFRNMELIAASEGAGLQGRESGDAEEAESRFDTEWAGEIHGQ